MNERERADRIAVWSLLAICDLATVAVLLATDDEPWLRVGLLAIAFAALGALAVVPCLRDALTTRAVVIATLALMVVSVAFASQQSHDLWSYAMQGRIVAHYGASPYLHAPRHYSHDPILHLVGTGWRGTRSVYGPAFTGIAAAIMGVTGTHMLATRLAFQLLAATAVLAAMFLVSRRTRDPVALLLIGVNPVIALEIVNTGRNDALVALAILAGLLLAGRRHVVAGAAMIALAALVKIVALAALGALLLWVWRRVGTLVAFRAAALSVAMVALGYACVGGTRALRPLANASDRLSRAAVWQLARADGIQHLFGSQPADPVRHVIAVVGPVALLAVAGLGLFFALSRLADPTPELVAASALVAFLLAGSYVLASYVVWVLPVLAWRHRAGISRLVLVWSALLVVAYQANGQLPADADDVVPWLMAFVTVLFAVAAIVVLVIAASRRLQAARSGNLDGAMTGQGVRPAKPASRSAIGASSGTMTGGPNNPVARMSSDKMPWAT